MPEMLLPVRKEISRTMPFSRLVNRFIIQVMAGASAEASPAAAVEAAPFKRAKAVLTPSVLTMALPSPLTIVRSAEEIRLKTSTPATMRFQSGPGKTAHGTADLLQAFLQTLLQTSASTFVASRAFSASACSLGYGCSLFLSPQRAFWVSATMRSVLLSRTFVYQGHRRSVLAGIRFSRSPFLWRQSVC